MTASTRTSGVAAYDAARWVNPPPLVQALQLGFGVKLLRMAADSEQPRSWEAVVPPAEDHVLIWRRGPRAPVEVAIDGRPDPDGARRGRNGYLVPAGAPSHWMARNIRPGMALHLHLPTAWLRQIAGQDSAADLSSPRFGLDGRCLGPLFDGLLAAWHDAGNPPLTMLEHWSLLLGAALLRPRPQPRRGTLDRRALQRLTEFLQGNLHRDIGLVDMADIADMPVRVFRRDFLATTGETPHAHLLRLRRDRARLLLRDRRLTDADVALLSGFRSGRDVRRQISRGA